MSKVLVIAEHLDGKLNASTARTVSAAQALSPQSIDIVVLAADPATVAAQAAQIAGVARVLPALVNDFELGGRERIAQRSIDGGSSDVLGLHGYY